jgi:hypothetical protein
MAWATKSESWKLQEPQRSHWPWPQHPRHFISTLAHRQGRFSLGNRESFRVPNSGFTRTDVEIVLFASSYIVTRIVQWYLGARVQSFFLGPPPKFLYIILLDLFKNYCNSKFLFWFITRKYKNHNKKILKFGDSKRSPRLRGPRCNAPDSPPICTALIVPHFPLVEYFQSPPPENKFFFNVNSHEPRFRRGRYFSFRLHVENGSTASQLPIDWLRGLEWPDHKDDRWLLYSFTMKNVWTYTSTPPYIFMARSLIKHRDNFIFNLNSQA